MLPGSSAHLPEGLPAATAVVLMEPSLRKHPGLNPWPLAIQPTFSPLPLPRSGGGPTVGFTLRCNPVVTSLMSGKAPFRALTI